MLQRCLDLLAPALEQPGAVVVDCTLGLGGHSEALLRRFPEARLVALDRDTEALRLSGERLAPYGESFPPSTTTRFSPPNTAHGTATAAPATR
jgi:16S rRNA (cytosine1402-N4)-methyltransferase